ncbi:MAG TPA: FkbM family methyltransferase [Puia sp.]|nr:FkbM family methyltransferase [Puia sp.]
MSLGYQIVNSFRNSRLHFFVCQLMEKFEMEGLTISHSMSGEDLILKHIFGKNKRSGFYVDIGCNNPIQKSNTSKLYIKGWQGICADGNAALIRKFRKIRRRDICLHAIVSDERKEMIFYQDKKEHEYSSVDAELGAKLKAENKNLVEIKMTSTTLADIFDQYLENRKIDLLCVDVEHHDLQVLRGNNFEKYRPRIICVEFDGKLGELEGSALHIFLTGVHYEVLAFSAPNVYYSSKLS